MKSTKPVFSGIACGVGAAVTYYLLNSSSENRVTSSLLTFALTAILGTIAFWFLQRKQG